MAIINIGLSRPADTPILGRVRMRLQERLATEERMLRAYLRLLQRKRIRAKKEGKEKKPSKPSR